VRGSAGLALDAARHRSLFANFFRRELFAHRLGSASGPAWAFLHPLALLALYDFVFSAR
jgi:lipopolysaccharide transport system permease protein